MPGKVFISHSHEDNDLCAPLLEALKTWGVDYWIDMGQLTGGDPIADKIGDAIRECDVFLRICTPAAMKSHYMARELDFFLQLQDDERRTHGVSRRKLVPLVLAVPYDGGVAEAGVKFISAVDRPRSEWLSELREALSVPSDGAIGHAGSESGLGVYPADADDQGRSQGSNAVARSPGLVAMLGEMDAAIVAELKKVERSTRGHVAVDGRFIGRVGGQCLYTFALREPWEPQDDAPIRVKVTPQRHTEAAVVTSSGNNITIAMSQELPEEALRHVTLVDDPRRLLEKLREVLDEVQEPEAQLASKAFTLLPARTGATPLPDLPPQFLQATASQRRAMQQALGNEVSYIIGPPGTGKTATLAAIAFALIKAGCTVLVAAHTNIAVDNAILKLAEYADGLPALQEGRIVRFGPPQLAAVRDHAAIYPPNIAKRVGRDLDACHFTGDTGIILTVGERARRAG